MSPTNEDKHREAYASAEAEVRALEPSSIAARSGMRWQGEVRGLADKAAPADEAALAGSTSSGRDAGPSEATGTLTFQALGTATSLTWPALSFDAVHPVLHNFAWQLIALHYIRMATGRRPGTDWVSYRELPDGLFYANTITREVEQPLARLFATDPEGFRRAALALGGTEIDVADVAVAFHPLPHVPVVFALWVEDEEFPAKMSVLYEREGTANLPLQDLRILADMLGAALKRAADPQGRR